MYGSANKARTALYGAAIIFGGLAILGLFDFAFGGQYPPRKSAPFADPSPKGTAKGGKLGLADFAAIRADKFCGAGAEGLNSALGGDAGFRVRGIIVHSDPARSLVFIEVPGEAEQSAYKAGDTVRGAKLLGIAENFAEFEIGGKPVRINLYETDEPVAAPPGPPPVMGTPPPPAAGPSPVDAGAQPPWLDKMPPQARELWLQASPEEREQFLKLSPEEQKKAVRKLLRQKRGPGGPPGPAPAEE
jgi:hypothetical protein